jgi:CBS domain-containing membrane protein
MTAQTIMSTDLVTVAPDISVARALLEMARHRVHNIPVVDREGAFVGLVSLRRLTHELLPTAARVDADAFHMDIGFLTDQSDEYVLRLLEIGKRPVSDLLEKKKKLRFCSPETPIPKLLQLLSENPTSLPVVVVEGKKKRVVGMVSNWDVLTKLAVRLLAHPQDPQAMNDGSPPVGEGGP